MSAEPLVRVSVTTLADFSCRVGDLMPAGVAGPTAREGMMAHKRVQTEAIEQGENRERVSFDSKGDNVEPSPDFDNSIEAEVSLSRECVVNGKRIKLRGRVDLLDSKKHKLSEIKTTLVPAQMLPESQKSFQWAQLYLYGYLYLGGESKDEHSLKQLELELIHVNLRAETQVSECKFLTVEAIEEFALQAIGIYAAWIKKTDNWRCRLSQSAAKMSFPYGGFRDGQRDMAAAVYRSSRDSACLLCEAPTGIGKTISTLFPATKALGEKGIKQVAYLTAKVAGRLSAMQAVTHLQAHGLELTAIQIRAKQSSCFCSNGRCERDEAGQCPMSLGFFDRLPAARDELIAQGVITESAIDEIAWLHQLCPFELCLQLLPWVHVVIADYNYVFDPLVSLPHFSESRRDTLLLVDEAHNLVDRSRSMFSADLSRVRMLMDAKTCVQSHPLVSKALDKVAKQMVSAAATQDGEVLVSDSPPKLLARSVSKSVELIMEAFGKAPALPESIGELFRILCRYAAINELFGDNHRCITRTTHQGNRKEVVITLFCLDASQALSKQYKQFNALIVFSATLRPGLFYRDALGMPENTSQLKLESPFDKKRAFHAVVNWIDTRYRQRQNSMPLLISLIEQVTSPKKGSYLVFFPSYAYLNQAYDAFVSTMPDVSVWRQESDQSKTEQRQLLDALDGSSHVVGFAILGGVFGEGIDYIGDKLIGAIIVSTGLPGLDAETQLVSELYTQSGHNGYDYAYRYPGFTRVLQTAGRVIRDEADKGVVVLVDDRFKQHFYQQLFPASWRLHHPSDQHALTDVLNKFWASLSEDGG